MNVFNCQTCLTTSFVHQTILFFSGKIKLKTFTSYFGLLKCFSSLEAYSPLEIKSAINNLLLKLTGFIECDVVFI